ncbi:hypothetical protein HUB98_06495 [Paenibacillus barcinonensis]|uniref:Uncharacterized protein n=1 Tax=Paenibacillus barcinonensis TaxID=198119 RepID=A0A2V4VWH9_PAEBA|nr:hypothetical protein [Paenibacillus barcinonensis]PYE51666.1 hypothetical protein DFQ00_102461 [Paenibacillus barcinonensis]QKS56026.1 hypothetical protein HUB98_06495 [Paenibacillus barcinonensis]
MILGNRQFTRSPVPQKFMWVADYYDGTNLVEYDFQTKKSNDFYSIDREKLISFGIIGQGSQLFYNVANGVFNINQDRFSISYIAEDEEFPLTGRAYLYNDHIQFKNGSSDANLNTRAKEGKFKNSIDCFNFGYKKSMNLNDVNINYQCVFSLPDVEIPYFQIKITSDKDLNGRLIIRKNGLIVDEIIAPLKANHSGNINWELR